MVSVVIPVFNKSELTERCLNSVLENSASVTEVFVIDNGSKDDTAALLTRYPSRFKNAGIYFEVVSNPKNLGFGSACNQGIRRSMGEFVAVLNNDTWLMKNWDTALMDSLQSDEVDVIGPFFDERPLAENPQATAERFLNDNSKSFRTHFVPILMFFKRQAVQQLKLDHGGIFDERYFVTYEDTDLLHRMKLLDLRYGQTSTCYIWHHSMGTRSTPGLLPSGYEVEGLSLFIEKWGFDPRKKEHTFVERLKRRYRKWRSKSGKF